MADERTGRTRVFVSYSRRDLHAALQFAGLLEEEGLDPWLDLERLTPGSDWNQEIEEAIDGAAALVVLASPAAVASVQVAREWQRAQQSGTPVRVAVFRRATLPAGLAGAPSADLRRRFEPAARALARSVRDGHAFRTPVARGGVCLPSPVFAVAFALACDFLAVLVYLLLGARAIWADEDPLSPGSGPWSAAVGIPLACVAFLAYLAGLLRGFANRDFRYPSVLIALLGAVPFFAVIGQLISGLVDALLHGQVDVTAFRTSNGYFAAYHVLTELALLPINLIAIRCLARTPAVFRWLPTGEGPPWLWVRAIGRRSVRVPGPRPADAVRSFGVSNSAADAPIAAGLTRAFRGAGLTEDDTDPDVRLVVLSNTTTWSWAAGLLRPKETIVVLASSVRLAEEGGELRRFHWIDHRAGNLVAIRALARSLRGSGGALPGESPVGIDRFAAPAHVRGAIAVLVALFTVFAGSALLSVTVAQSDPERRHQVPYAKEFIPDPDATAPDGRRKTYDEVFCERRGRPADLGPGFPDCTLVQSLPPRDAEP